MQLPLQRTNYRNT